MEYTRTPRTPRTLRTHTYIETSFSIDEMHILESCTWHTHDAIPSIEIAYAPFETWKQFHTAFYRSPSDVYERICKIDWTNVPDALCAVTIIDLAAFFDTTVTTIEVSN